MLDKVGNLVTSNQAIEELAIDTYKKRLENRVMRDEAAADRQRRSVQTQTKES